MVGRISSVWHICISLSIIFGTQLMTKFENYLMDYLQLPRIRFLTGLTMISITVVGILKQTKLNIFMDSSAHVFFLRNHKHLGISLAISASILTIVSCYLSIYDIERSVSCMYRTFTLAIASVIITYGTKDIPASYTILSVSYIGAAFAIFSLVPAISPVMMNPGYIALFMCGFYLLLSALLFLMNIMRSETIVTGFPLNEYDKALNSLKFNSDKQLREETNIVSSHAIKR